LWKESAGRRIVLQMAFVAAVPIDLVTLLKFFNAESGSCDRSN